MAQGSGSVGGRRGGKVEADMSLAQAKSFQKKTSSKPALGTSATNDQSKVTNKPRTSGKRMK
jgi:hypothetical protein